MTELHYIIVSAALLISLILSHAYAAFLSPLQRVYVPDWIDIPVILGNLFILGTVAALEYGFSVVVNTVLVAAVMVAWGIPIEIWQHSERIKRWRRKRQAEQEGISHGKTTRSPRSP